MKILLITSIILLTFAIALTAGEPWKIALDAGLMMSQNSYSDNWTGGETGSMLWSFNSNFLARKKISDRLRNRYSLKLAYGQTHNQSSNSKKWTEPQKSTDLIDFETVFRFTFNWYVDPYLAGRVESQFHDASDTLKTRYFNPALFTESAGVARMLLETEKQEWSVRLGAAFRQRLNRDALNNATNEREDKTIVDGGFELVNDFSSPIAKDRIMYTGKLTIYKAVVNSESDELIGDEKDYWKTIDVSWENIFSANITEYLIVNLYMQLLYDKEIDLAGRFKQTLSLGLTYKFI